MLVKKTGEIGLEMVKTIAQMMELSNKLKDFDLSKMDSLPDDQIVAIAKIAQEEMELRSKLNTLKWVLGLDVLDATGDIAPGSTAG
jgi:ribosomal protein L11